MVGQSELEELLERWRLLLAERRRLRADEERLARDEDRLRSQLLAATGNGPAESDTAADRSVPAATTRPPDRLTIHLLGRFSLRYGPQAIPPPQGALSASLLRMLAAAGCAGLHKEQLADRLWPEAGTRASRRNLHQVVYSTRRHLAAYDAADQLRYDADRYSLGDEHRWCDVDALSGWADRLRAARHDGDNQAIVEAATRIDDLYAGPLLLDQPYDECVEQERERLRRLHREAVGVLIAFHAEAEAWLDVVRCGERLLDLDPTDEDAARQLMRAHLAVGQEHLAVLVYDTHRRTLETELGIEPSLPTRQLAAALSGA